MLRYRRRYFDKYSVRCWSYKFYRVEHLILYVFGLAVHPYIATSVTININAKLDTDETHLVEYGSLWIDSIISYQGIMVD